MAYTKGFSDCRMLTEIIFSWDRDVGLYEGLFAVGPKQLPSTGSYVGQNNSPQWGRTPAKITPSIGSYAYSPCRAFFVAALWMLGHLCGPHGSRMPTIREGFSNTMNWIACLQLVLGFFVFFLLVLSSIPSLSLLDILAFYSPSLPIRGLVLWRPSHTDTYCLRATPALATNGINICFFGSVFCVNMNDDVIDDSIRRCWR